MTSLGYLGPKGTYTEIAAKECNGKVDEYIAFDDIRSLFMAVKEKEVEKAIVPIENSLEGAVTLTLDLLVEIDLQITDEIIIPINHSLIANEKIELSEIKNVISHPQALAQCRSFLQNRLDDYNVNTASSTAEAVKQITKLDQSWAAIANHKLAEFYPVEILAEGIQDNKNNWTRFVILGREESEITDNDKTSLILSPGKDKPGNLYKILREFARFDINLTRIESRPAKKKLGDYIFFIDCEGHHRQKKLANLLEKLAKKTKWLKVLGSYPKAEI